MWSGIFLVRNLTATSMWTVITSDSESAWTCIHSHMRSSWRSVSVISIHSKENMSMYFVCRQFTVLSPLLPSLEWMLQFCGCCFHCVFGRPFVDISVQRQATLIKKVAIFWFVVPCILVEVHWCFIGTLAITSETLANFYQTVQRYDSEDSHLHTSCHENLKSCLTW
jgi:hypothetical protein